MASFVFHLGTIGLGALGATSAISGVRGLFDAMSQGTKQTGPLGAELARTEKEITTRLRRKVPDYDLSGDRSPAKLGVKRVMSQGKNGTFEGELTATGPWQLVEWDTSPHTIYRHKPGKALRTSNGQYRRAVHHPGTRGAHIWEDGTKDAEKNVLKAASSILLNAMALGGGVSLMGAAAGRTGLFSTIAKSSSIF